MEERDWLIIKILYERKSITKTAEELFMAQPTLTIRIHKIEEDLGVKLIMHRSNKGVLFTPEGEYLAEFAKKILLDTRKVREKVTNLGNDVKGTLLIGASIYVTRYILPRLLLNFKNQYPDVDFRVITTMSQDIFKLMRRQDSHIGFVRSDYGWQDEKCLLFEEPMCVFSKEPISLNDLPKLPRIDYHSDYLNTVLLNTWWSENFTEPPFTSMFVNQVDICKDMVINGLGYAILPSKILSDTNDMHKIYITDKTGQPLLRKTWMLYHEKLLEINLVRAFVDYVKTIDFNNII